jgi:hypothetical protein
MRPSVATDRICVGNESYRRACLTAATAEIYGKAKQSVEQAVEA